LSIALGETQCERHAEPDTLADDLQSHRKVRVSESQEEGIKPCRFWKRYGMPCHYGASWRQERRDKSSLSGARVTTRSGATISSTISSRHARSRGAPAENSFAVSAMKWLAFTVPGARAVPAISGRRPAPVRDGRDDGALREGPGAHGRARRGRIVGRS
jgi:hypothetical protein